MSQQTTPHVWPNVTKFVIANARWKMNQKWNVDRLAPARAHSVFKLSLATVCDTTIRLNTHECKYTNNLFFFPGQRTFDSFAHISRMWMSILFYENTNYLTIVEHSKGRNIFRWTMTIADEQQNRVTVNFPNNVWILVMWMI